MWAGQEPWAPCTLSAFSYKLVVLVTVSRFWLGVACYTSLGISGVQQDPHSQWGLVRQGARWDRP